MPPRFAIRHHAALGSTQDEARTLARDGAAAGTVVRADLQTGGRGRHRRAWSSPSGNLHCTVLLRPAAAARLTDLGFLAAVALAETVDPWLGAAGPATLKWPNDVLAAGGKLAGILVETEAGAALLGIGLNLRAAPPDAAAILPLAGAAPAPAPALDGVLDRLGAWLGRWEADGFEPVRQAWLARGPAAGTRAQVRAPGGVVAGAFAGLDADGALLLRDEDGLRRVAAGEVWFEGSAGSRPLPRAPDVA